MWQRQFSSFDEAIAYLRERGALEYFGRAGRNMEYCVYNLRSNDGRLFHIDIYDDGKIEVRSGHGWRS